MLKNILISLRPHFWLLSIIPATIGAYLANGHIIDGYKFLLVAILIGPCISGISELVNDYADRETDAKQKTKKIWRVPFSGGSGVVFSGGITKSETLTVTALLAAGALVIAWSINTAMIALVLAGLFVALEYSLGPLHAKSSGIAGPLLFAFGFRGLLSFHAGWLAFAPIDAASLSISLFLGLLFFATFELSHLADYTEDKLLGIKTFPVQIGFDNAKIVAGGFFTGGLVWLSIAFYTGLVTTNALVLLWLPASIVFLQKYMQIENNPKKITDLVPLALLVICTAPFIFI